MIVQPVPGRARDDAGFVPAPALPSHCEHLSAAAMCGMDHVTLDAGIRRLHARYIDAVWRKDAAAFGGCFTEDATWLVGGQVLQGPAAIIGAISGIFERANRIFMEFGTPLVEAKGSDRASARTYVSERVSWHDGRTNMNLGRYFERVVLCDGEWRFAWRLFQKLYTGPADLTGEWFDQPDFGPPPAMPPLDYRP